MVGAHAAGTRAAETRGHAPDVQRTVVFLSVKVGASPARPPNAA